MTVAKPNQLMSFCIYLPFCEHSFVNCLFSSVFWELALFKNNFYIKMLITPKILIILIRMCVCVCVLFLNFCWFFGQISYGYLFLTPKEFCATFWQISLVSGCCNCSFQKWNGWFENVETVFVLLCWNEVFLLVSSLY